MTWPFGKSSKSFLGIDIGTSNIKVVELSGYGKQVKLKNYGCLSIPSAPSIYSRKKRKKTALFSSKRSAELLGDLLKEMKVKSSKAVFSIPDFSTLFINFNLPSMKESELSEAVRFEARHRVPLPISEVTLNWVVTRGSLLKGEEEKIEILLVVVPNSIIDQYIEIAEICNIELLSLEAEVFGLQRALVGEKEETSCLVDIGAYSTTCSIIDKRVLKISHSFDISGNDFTERISKSLNLDYDEARALKYNQGLTSSRRDVSEVLEPLFDTILGEIKRVIDIFYEKEGREVQSFILAGGSAALPGLKKYFSEALDLPMKIAFPFADMVYPSILERELRKIGPELCIATGMALKSLKD